MATATRTATAPILGPNSGLALAVLGFVVVQQSLAAWPTALRWWTDLAWTGAALLAALKALQLAREPHSPLARAWGLIGAGCLAWTMGMGVWAYQELITGEVTPFPGLADIGYLLFAPLVAAGLLTYRVRGRGLPFTLLEFSQLGIFVCCVMIVHLLAFAPRLAEPSHYGLYLTVALAYPVAYMSLLVQALASLWASPPGPARRPLAYFAAGLAVFAVVNSLYAFALIGDEYAVGHYLDAGWIAAFLLIWHAAAEAQPLGLRAEGGERRGVADLPRTLRVTALAPVLALLATAAVVFWQRGHIQGPLVDQLLPAGVLLIGFLGLREWSSHEVRERLDRAIRDSELRFRRFFDASPAIIGISRLSDGRFVDVSESFEELSGWSREEAVGRTATELGLWPEPDERDAVLARLRTAGGALRAVELHMRTRTGELRDLMASMEVLAVDGQDCLFVVASDVTERRRAEAQMRKLSRALQQTAEAVMITDAGGAIEYVNPAFEAITGYTAAELQGRSTEILQSSRHEEQYYADLWHALRNGEVFSDVFTNRRKDGSLYYEERTITPLKNEQGEITHFIATGRDISDRVHTQQRLEYLAHHDALTALPNRALLLDRLAQALSRARWHRRLVAVLFIDIDRFKNINDTLGHEAGDHLLAQVGRHLTSVLRERDTVARFGGDEFVVLLDDVAEAADVAYLAEKLLNALQTPLLCGSTTLHVTASIGISLFPNDGGDAGTLLKNADVAMYRAKDLGRNAYQFYSAEMTARAFERLTLENALRRALEQDQFRLHYQPQVDIDSGRIVGVEALLRWQHPELGMVRPDDFVPVLEETGLITQTGPWVLEEACAQLARWRAAGHTELQLSVNLSPREFVHGDLPVLVREVLERHRIPPGHLELEITESTLMQHGAQIQQALDGLAELGVRMAIDDFGTGYSSLAYLRRFSIDTLKIDRTFVRDIPGDEDDAAIVTAIASLGRALHLRLIAEGVESVSQRDFLAGIGCHLVQGFLYSPAVDAESLRLEAS